MDSSLILNIVRVFGMVVSRFWVVSKLMLGCSGLLLWCFKWLLGCFVSFLDG